MRKSMETIVYALTLLVAICAADAALAQGRPKPHAQPKAAPTSTSSAQEQAEADRALIPFYAITKMRLADPQSTFPEMPQQAIDAARTVGSSVSILPLGRSQVTISGMDVVTFTIRAPQAFQGVDTRFEEDPLDRLLKAVHGMHNDGIVFARSGTEVTRAIPSGGCRDSVIISGNAAGAGEACKRFHIGESPTATPPKTEATAEESLRRFLTNVMATYGTRGVLTRKEMFDAMNAELFRAEALWLESGHRTGYVRVDRSTGQFQLQNGDDLIGSIQKLPDEPQYRDLLRVNVEVYNDRLTAMKVSLRYADGTPVSQTALGNTTEELVLSHKFKDMGFSRLAELAFHLPPDRRHEEIRVIVNAIDEKDTLIIRDIVIATVPPSPATPPAPTPPEISPSQ